MKVIPVFSPTVDDADIGMVTDALLRGEISGNFGNALDRFEHEFAEAAGCRFGVATNSGTTALHLALAAAGVGAGDEVIVSSSTNIATALAAVYVGATPVPADVDPATWTIDLRHADTLVTSRTKAIIPVHLFGRPVDADELVRFADRHQLLVVEDCAQAHGAKWHGRQVGSIGHMGAFSFYANKVVTTGEGGMVTTNDDAMARKLRYLKNLAFGTPRFYHEEIGFNYRMTGYQAALGLSQTRRLNQTIEEKRRVYRLYKEELGDLDTIQWQDEPDAAFHVHWMAALRILPSAGLDRDGMADALKCSGIETRTFFCPMNQQPCLKSQPEFRPTPCPVADQLWLDGLYLPSSTSLSEQDIKYIADVFRRELAGR